MHAPESGDGGIDARQLHADESVQQHASAGAAIAVEADAADSKRGDLGNKVEGKLIAHPIVFDDRRNFAVHVPITIFCGQRFQRGHCSEK